MHNSLPISLFDHVSCVIFFIGDSSLVGEPPSRVRKSVSFQNFIAEYQSYKRKVLANIKVLLKILLQVSCMATFINI